MEPCGSKEQLNILVVDDDHFIREIYEELLRGIGHRVSTAENYATGEKSINDSIATGAPYDVLVVDNHMPCQGDPLGRMGPELAEYAWKKVPDITIVMTTGDDINHLRRKHPLLNNIVILQKPVIPITKLLDAIHDARMNQTEAVAKYAIPSDYGSRSHSPNVMRTLSLS